MQIIDNANSLLNAIKNNSYLTINDDGQIVKQSTFKGILRKIGDFFKNNFGGGKAVTERQEKLSTAMYQMLSKSNLSFESYEGIRNSVIKSFENSELKLTATKLKAMSQINKIDPGLREFVKGAIEDLDKLMNTIGSDNYCTLMDNIMHTMSNVFKDFDPNNPDMKNLKNIFKNSLQEHCMQEATKNADEDFSAQFNKDVYREHYNVNGKVSIAEDGYRNEEGIRKELMALFPNKTTRRFVSELLSQTTGNSTANVLMNEDRDPDGIIKSLNAKVPDAIPGKFDYGLGLDMDELDVAVDPNKPVYYMEATSQGGTTDGGNTLEVKRDDDGNIIGATIKRDQCFKLKSNQYGEGYSLGKFYFSTKIELDLRDPEKPQILDVDLSYGGKKIGTDFGVK